MIIVSNKAVKHNGWKRMSYDEFKRQAFGDGLDVDDNLIINVSEIESDVFDSCVGVDIISFFTEDGNVPDFVKKAGVEVDDWSKKDELDSMFGVSNGSTDRSITEDVLNLMDDATGNEKDVDDQKDAKIYVFGSSKGGTGKTFTAVMSTYMYAKKHPYQKIALVDFDIIDGQVGISIHRVKPTMRNYYREYQKGYKDFQSLHNFAVKANNTFPQNVDFYLAPSNGTVIDNPDFWINIINVCRKNYDVVVFDTGIDYLNIAPISYAYKIADKILLITTTSIKSVNSINKQISKLKGETKNGVFSEEDEIAPRLNIIITQMLPSNTMNKQIFNSLQEKANVIATFGVITDSVSRAEYFGEWDVFDSNKMICQAFEKIMA